MIENQIIRANALIQWLVNMQVGIVKAAHLAIFLGHVIGRDDILHQSHVQFNLVIWWQYTDTCNKQVKYMKYVCNICT